MNLKKLAAAAALACTAPAFAAINISDTNAELFAMVWDENHATYFIDLGVSVGSLSALNGQLSFAVAGPAWSDYLAADGNLADYEPFQGTRWAIVAVDFDDQLTYEAGLPGDVNLYTTTQDSMLPRITNEGVETTLNLTWRQSSNFDQRGGDLNVAANTSGTVLVGDEAHFLENTQPLRIGNAIGTSSASLFTCSYSGFRDFVDPALCAAVTNARGQAVTVGFDGQAFTVTAVPEPGTYAMLLAGLGAVGFMVRRRRA